MLYNEDQPGSDKARASGLAVSHPFGCSVDGSRRSDILRNKSENFKFQVASSIHTAKEDLS